MAPLDKLGGKQQDEIPNRGKYLDAFCYFIVAVGAPARKAVVEISLTGRLGHGRIITQSWCPPSAKQKKWQGEHSPETGEQGSRRSVSIATPQAEREIDRPGEGPNPAARDRHPQGRDASGSGPTPRARSGSAGRAVLEYRMEGMKLDKVKVARRQLCTALAPFIEDLDPVSVHTLACAGGEIAKHLTHKAGAKPFSSYALATFPDLDMKEIRRLQRQFCNAFKHATTHGGKERADQKLLRQFNDLQNDHMLFVGWYDYMLAVKAMPIEAQAFQAWYFALYPEKLNPSVDTVQYKAIFPGLGDQPRTEQKKRLREAIGKARANKAIMEIMDDPRTEREPLIVSA